MGQVVSLDGSGHLSWPEPRSRRTQMPYALEGRPTTIHDIGQLVDGEPCYWHVENGLRRLPLCVGYKATTELFGMGMTMQIRGSDAKSRQPVFVVTLHRPHDVGLAIQHMEFVGRTPTEPFMKMSLAINRMDLNVDGMELFGFKDARVQSMLRAIGQPTGLQDRPVTQLLPGAPSTIGARSGGNMFQKMSMTDAVIHTLSQYSYEGLASKPEFSPHWRPPPGWEPRLGEPQLPGNLPLKRAPSRDIQRPTLHAATLTSRPASRSRRPSSGEGRVGRGWTAFTAFGLEERAKVRQEFPHFTPTEVEKMVGQRWAALKPGEKQYYVEVAQEARRASQGTFAGAPPSESLEQTQSLQRTTSDAATLSPQLGADERQLRPKRRIKYSQFGEDFIDPDAGEPAETVRNKSTRPSRPRSAGRRHITKRQSAATPPISRHNDYSLDEALRKPSSAPLPSTIKERTASEGHAVAEDRSFVSRKRHRSSDFRNDEADVVGMLAEMRADVVTSESSEGS